MTTQLALASFSWSACWAGPASHPPMLNRTTGLWLRRDSVIWVTMGLPLQPCTHTLSRQRTHQHEHRQRNMRSSTNITGIYCARSHRQTETNGKVHTPSSTMDAALPFNLSMIVTQLCPFSSYIFSPSRREL